MVFSFKATFVYFKKKCGEQQRLEQKTPGRAFMMMVVDKKHGRGAAIPEIAQVSCHCQTKQNSARTERLMLMT